MKTNRIFFPNYHLNLFFKLSSSIFKRLTIFNPSSLIFHLILIFNLSSLILISSCSKKGTDPDEETVTFSGKVTLEGQTDHSGVTIALYKPVELDTALVRINQQYPNIGVQISQETEFDHREHTPVVTTVSDAGGNWKIENVTEGEYNVVVEKEDYGFRYKTNGISNSAINLTMGGMIVLQGNYNQNVVIPENAFVRVANDVEISATLVIGANTTFLFANNATLKVIGSITQNSNSGYTRFLQENETPSSGLILENVNGVSLNNLFFIGLRQGIVIRSCSNIAIQNSVFKNLTTGIDIFNSESISISNNLNFNCLDGIISNKSKNNIIANILYDILNVGYVSLNDQKSNLSKNLFEFMELAISINLNGFGFALSEVVFEENDFRNNETHIRWSNTGLPSATNNNFLNCKNQKIVAGNSMNSTFSFTNNYWGSSNISEIENMIYHQQDDNILGLVDFSNFKSVYYNWH